MSLRTWKEAPDWYQNDSVLLRTPHESVMEIFPALELLHFDLYLGNRAFLDFGWELPIYKK